MKANECQVVPWADGGAQVIPEDLQVECGSNTFHDLDSLWIMSGFHYIIHKPTKEKVVGGKSRPKSQRVWTVIEAEGNSKIDFPLIKTSTHQYWYIFSVSLHFKLVSFWNTLISEEYNF